MIFVGCLIACVARADVVSTFDTSNDGWISNFGGPAPWVPTGGNPSTGGYIYGERDSFGNIYSPPKFGGNQLAATALNLDVQLNFPYATIRNNAVQLIAENSYVISHPLQPLPTTSWQSFSLPLNTATGWHVLQPTPPLSGDQPSDALMQYVLANLRGIMVDTNYSSGYRVNLDNVRLVGGTPFSPINKDHPFNPELKNKGPVADGIRVLFGGDPGKKAIYGGHPGPPGVGPRGFFNSVDYQLTPMSASIYWTQFSDDDNNRIDPGQQVHVGADLDNRPFIEDMYYTDQSGNRIAGSAIYDIGADMVYDPSTQNGRLVFANVMDPQDMPTGLITVSNVRYAVLGSEMPLADLNSANAALDALLQNLPGGASNTLDFLDRKVLDIPGTFPVGSSIVIEYLATSPGSAADVLNFMEFTVSVPEPSSAVLLIAGATVYVFGPRRQVASKPWPI